ncbi:hypothetical protein [Cupriavidus sp. TMH.W2]|uniref:hypothetical protein n=1 Tax=Cupriavidus sp. TMH.W2 TaxID=3434465 RepID=UPI003D77A24B
MHAGKASEQKPEVSDEAAALGFESDHAMWDHARWLDRHGSPEYKSGLRHLLTSSIRRLNETEIIRLESAIKNEEKCLAAGRVFSEYEMEEEGRWVLGCGSFRASYLETLATGMA